ncbi:MAG: DUF1800 domain-containing protein, partial [Pseudomonadota bacterium]|nr:DUF1800 domain-containing protein [Pseudomonadota bacterium]
MDTRTVQALVRFGLGRRGSEALPSDPAAWLHSQLHAPPATPSGPIPTGPMPPAAATGSDAAPNSAAGLEALRADLREKPPPGQSRARALYRGDATAALSAALTTPAPFRERLVWFWANHFTVSVRRGVCAALIGPFIAEAVRPHVVGRFEDMLLAVMRHPAMLLYLDNAASIGPESPAGRRTGRGINENLARECLELHTVSPAAGYTQADVTSFANILTGWSVEVKQDPPGFRFRDRAHEPGAKMLIGRSFPPGEEGGVQALAFLASHPKTHRFLAAKLACHFVADDPPVEVVRHIEGTLRDTSGDLGAAAHSL